MCTQDHPTPLRGANQRVLVLLTSMHKLDISLGKGSPSAVLRVTCFLPLSRKEANFACCAWVKVAPSANLLCLSVHFPTPGCGLYSSARFMATTPLVSTKSSAHPSKGCFFGSLNVLMLCAILPNGKRCKTLRFLSRPAPQ